MISGSNEQLQQQLEYTRIKPDCHSWWISKMQSGREDILEERYAIKFCLKLGKNDATETYGMLQTAFQPSCMNRAWVFEWHMSWKKLWRRSLTRSHKRTSMGHSRSCWNGTTRALQPGEITSKGTRVSRVYYQQKCPYEKSLETYLMILVFFMSSSKRYYNRKDYVGRERDTCLYIKRSSMNFLNWQLSNRLLWHIQLYRLFNIEHK